MCTALIVRSTLRAAIVAATSLLLAAAAAPPPARASEAALSPGEQSQLLQEYQPVTYHAQEPWAPTTVTAFIDGADVEQRHEATGWHPLSPAGALPTSPGTCSQHPCYRLNLRACKLAAGVTCYNRIAASLSSWQQTAVYGTAVPAHTRVDPALGVAQPAYLLHYFYFYPFDDWHWPLSTPGLQVDQVHEGDWEHVTIGLSAATPPKPLFAAYSSHCGGRWRPWPSAPNAAAGHTVRLEGATHPVVFVALGSHANYFTRSSPLTKPLRCRFKSARTGAVRLLKAAFGGALRVVDRTGALYKLGPKGVAPRTTRLVELPAILPAWARFKGSWSEGNLLLRNAAGAKPSGGKLDEGPPTPAFHGDDLATIFTNPLWAKD